MNIKKFQEIKLKLYAKCLGYVEQRIANAQTALANASESGNDETKSSAGDKHETGRAMAQLEQEKSSKQLFEALELKKMFKKCSPKHGATVVSHGSLVITSNGNFYISISMGKIIMDDTIYYAISPATPIANLLMGKKEGDTFYFKEQSYKIEKII